MVVRPTAFRALLNPVFGQSLLALGALASLALAPPAQGRMLMLSIRGQSAEALVGMARDRGGLILRQGPVAGSLVVMGDRAMLGGTGIVLLAAPVAICGGGDA